MDLKKEYENWNGENVRSLFWSEALKVLRNEMSNLDFNVVVLQETRLESCIQKFENFALFNSGSERKKHEFGCGFYVSGEFLKHVKDFETINERICCLRLKAKWFSGTLINVHAPTNEKMGRDKRILEFIRAKYKSNS